MTKKYYVLQVTAILVFLLSSCVTSRHINYLQKPSRSIPDYVDTVGFKEYRLQKGDYLNIVVHSLEKSDLSLYNCGGNSANLLLNSSSSSASSRLCSYVVDENGKIDYPYLGDIFVLGKTIREVKFELESLFRSEVAKYLSVDVYLANRSFSIIGEGESSRIMLPHEKITLFQALAMAKDLSLYADRSKIKLVRNTKDGTIVKEFDLRSEKIIDSEFYYIQPNDVLYVQHSFSKYIGITHVSNAISVTLSTASFGLMVYNLVKRFAIDNKK